MPVSDKLRRNQPRVRKSPAPRQSSAVSIESVIHIIRGERVILDADLAHIYGVATKVFKQAVRRNLKNSRQTSCWSSQMRKLRICNAPENKKIQS